jgi:hypothetical protein
MRAQSFVMFPLEAQMQPSASRQMPSGPTPSAQIRRFERAPSCSMSNAVSRAAKDSATTSVLLSGVMTMPLGKASSLATSRASPSGVTSAILPGVLPLVSTSLNWAKSKLIVLT